jgi:uncharacterized protein YndB with AHSA1/START domain
MSEYMSMITVNCPSYEVFEFISDVTNMPQYLPTVHRADFQPGDRVEVEGEANGRHYVSDGWFDVSEDSMRMTWGSDGENKYSGHMQVVDAGDKSQVTVGLRFEPKPHQEAEFRRQMGSRDAAIQEGLNKALQSIKNVCEGKGGKVPSSADTQNRGYVS